MKRILEHHFYSREYIEKVYFSEIRNAKVKDLILELGKENHKIIR